MIDIIKKSVLAGIGAAIVTKEKVEGLLDEFVREGKVTAEDARRMAEKISSQGREEFHSACSELGDKLRELTNGASRQARAQAGALEKRLRNFEKRLGRTASGRVRAGSGRSHSSSASAGGGRKSSSRRPGKRRRTAARSG